LLSLAAVLQNLAAAAQVVIALALDFLSVHLLQ
jgi:hypothetical protein